MCGILREVEAEGVRKGLQKGMQEGMQEGLQKGMQEGLQKGMQEGKKEIIKTLMIKNNCSIEEAMDMIDVLEDEREQYKKMILG